MARFREGLGVVFLAALSGVLLFVSLAWSAAWPVAFVALVPLLFALRGVSVRGSLGLGAVAGASAHLLGFAWLPVRLASGVHGSLLLTCVGMLVLIVWESGALALSCAVFRWAHRRGLPEGIAWAFSLVTGELVYPKIIPITLSASLLGVPSLLAVMDLMGAAGPVVLIGVTNAALLSLGEALRSRDLRGALPRCGLALGVAASLVGYGVLRQYQVSNYVRSAEVVRILVVQVKSSADTKRNEPQKLLAEQIALTERGLKEFGGDLVIWAETAISQPVSAVASENLVRRRFGAGLSVPVVVGVALNHGTWLTNSVLLIPPLTAPACKACRYDKQLLVPITEWLPEGRLGAWLRSLMPRAGKFRVGDDAGEMELVGGHHAALFICYEILFPSYVQSKMSEKTELIVNASSDVWFAGTFVPELHLRLARLRAIEHRRYLVRASSNGVSAIVNPFGDVMAQLPEAVSGAASANVRWLHERTGFERWGNLPTWLAVAFLAWCALRRSPAGSH